MALILRATSSEEVASTQKLKTPGGGKIPRFLALHWDSANPSGNPSATNSDRPILRFRATSSARSSRLRSTVMLMRSDPRPILGRPPRLGFGLGPFAPPAALVGGVRCAG